MKIEKLLLATRSSGKLRELRPMFEGLGISINDLTSLGLPETAEEEGIEKFETFEENAVAKAQYFHKLSGGFPTIADDSGLAVDALDGRPGVRSKRWSGRGDLQGQALDDANNAKLLLDLTEFDVGLRAKVRAGSPRFPFPARYVCVAAFIDKDVEIVRRGETTGVIIDVPRGTEGFGYDPYFKSEAVGGTFAEASLEEKSRVSHRGRAFRALTEALRERGVL